MANIQWLRAVLPHDAMQSAGIQALAVVYWSYILYILVIYHKTPEVLSETGYQCN